MAQGKKSFVFYTEWEELFEALNDEEAGKLIKHVLRYVNDKEPQAPDRLTDISFIPIKQTLKRDLKKYEEKAKAARLNGLKGGRPKKVTKPKETKKTQPFFEEPKKAVNVNDNVNDNAIDSKNPNEQPPTIEQVKAYFQQRQVSSIEANAFFDFWGASNWCNDLGKNVNWQQKAISWISRIDKKQKEQLKDPYAHLRK